MPPWNDSMRGDVDDLAGRFLPDLPGDDLTEEEDGVEVDVDHVVPVLFGEVDEVGAADDRAALLTRMSAPPSAARVAARILSAAPGAAMSMGIVTDLRPSAAISRASGAFRRRRRGRRRRRLRRAGPCRRRGRGRCASPLLHRHPRVRFRRGLARCPYLCGCQRAELAMVSATVLVRLPSRRSATCRVPQIRVLPVVSRAEATAGVCRRG